MAKRSNKLSKVQNMPLSKLMSLSRAELLDATKMLTRESNRRLTVMKKKGLKSPSTEYIRKHGGKFRTTTRRGNPKSVTELREEFQRAKGFLESKTSTVSGYRQWESNVASTLAEQGIDYMSLTEQQKRRFWQAFSKLEELDQANTLKGTANYKSSVNEIYQAVKYGFGGNKTLLKRDIDAFAAQLNSDLYAASKKDFNASLAIGKKYSQF